MKIVREIIVKEVVFIKNRHSNFDTIMVDYKFAKCLFQSEHGYSKEILIQFFIFQCSKYLKSNLVIYLKIDPDFILISLL